MIDSPATRVFPWQAEPRQLVSVFEMIRFYAASFAKMVSNLERAESMLVVRFADDAIAENLPAMLAEELLFVYEHVPKLPLSPVIQSQADRLRAFHGGCDFKDSRDVHTLHARIQDFKIAVVVDLKQHLFLLVPQPDRELYTAPEVSYWTTRVVTAFADAHRDMKAAAQCTALGMWTASVFHSMRTVQYGLHKLADRLQVPLPKDIEVMQWGEILDAIEKRLRAMRQLTKTTELDAEIQFGTNASSHFWGIKEAWRNYVMHGRSTYDETEARTIMANVRAIMAALA
jgi:hypothetical protein